MPDGTAMTDIGLVPGRECGPCTVCCVALTIDDPDLRKVQGYRCRNMLPGKGCGIYETRPQACRAFFCGWRQLKWVRPTLRPDQSGVLIRLHHEVSKTTREKRLGVMITLLTDAALKAEGLAETVAAAVNAEIPVFLHVPGPPGHTAAEARVNDVLRDAVITRDRPALLEILRRARAKAKAGKFKPIVLPPRPAGRGEP